MYAELDGNVLFNVLDTILGQIYSVKIKTVYFFTMMCEVGTMRLV